MEEIETQQEEQKPLTPEEEKVLKQAYDIVEKKKGATNSEKRGKVKEKPQKLTKRKSKRRGKIAQKVKAVNQKEEVTER